MNFPILIWCLLFSSICLSQQTGPRYNVDSLEKMLDRDELYLNKTEFKLNRRDLLSDAKEKPASFKIVNKKNTLYLLEDGSGRIFKTSIKLDSLTRIDETKYGGHCFGANVFLYQDTIYSIGGYGFWQLNGVLRFFDFTTKEWSFKPTNIDVSFADGVNSISYYDKKSNKLFLLFEKITKETVLASENEDGIYLAELNLPSKQWIINEGKVDRTWGDKISDFREIINGPDGLILNSKKSPNTLFINFSKKEVVYIDRDFVTQTKQLFSSTKNYLTFWNGDTLSIFNLDKDSVWSIPLLKSKDSKPLLAHEKSKYISKIDHQYFDIALIIVLLSLIVVVFYLLKTKKPISLNQEVSSTENKIRSYKSKDFFTVLDFSETEVLRLITKNSVNNARTSIDEINKVLQITSRPYKIQNNIRAEIIAQINKKYSIFNEIKEELITRRRASFDKRYLEYEINERLLKKIADIAD